MVICNWGTTQVIGVGMKTSLHLRHTRPQVRTPSAICLGSRERKARDGIFQKIERNLPLTDEIDELNK
jgi:hypothetical protein